MSVYTESPLIWGIHVPASSRLRSVEELAGARYAISRRGSGSHLMAFVHARERGWPLDRLELVVVRDLKGAIDAFAQDGADVFFWEKFMTKPLVDDGRFRRVADFTGAGPRSSSAQPTRRSRHARPARCRRRPRARGRSPHAARRPRRRAYSPRRRQWLAATRWATQVGVERRSIAPVVDALRAAGLIDGFRADAQSAPLP